MEIVELAELEQTNADFSNQDFVSGEQEYYLLGWGTDLYEIYCQIWLFIGKANGKYMFLDITDMAKEQNLSCYQDALEYLCDQYERGN